MKSEEMDRKVAVIQAWWRGEMVRNKIRKMVRTFTKRKYIIRELVETEEKYIRDLSLVISDFKGNLIKKKIITQEQSHILFSNIDQIRQLNELFFASIFNQAQNYSHYKIIFSNVQKEIPFFKIYFEYFNNFNQSNALVNSLSEDNEDFNLFFSEARANPKYHQLTLKDYLIKPVQRLPKYVLIMKQVKKLTPPDHPDMKNIEKVLLTFQDVNNSNNQKLNQVLNSYKIGQIQRNLVLPHDLSEPGVEFILEESVSVLSMDGQVKQGTLYLLNTELIVARRSDREREKVLSCVPFRHGGEIMENQEHFYYKNSFTVQNGQGDSCTFVFQTSEEKDILLQKVFSQLMKAQQKNLEKLASLYHSKSPASVVFLRKMNRLDLLPEIQVLGTEERNDSMFKYTVYIIEVKIKTIRQKLFLRFSDLLSLQQLALGKGLNIKNELMKTTWLLNHKPKKIEQRKMNIQRFLKELLSKQEVVEDGDEILEALGLPYSFYKLPEVFKDGQEIMKKSTISQRSTNSQEEHHHKTQNNHSIVHRGSSIRHSKRSSIFNSIPELMVQSPNHRHSKNRQISIQDILQANQINLGHFTRLSQALYRCSQKEQTLSFNILIPWIENEKGFVRQKIIIGQGQKVYFLIEKVASQINLKYFKDFRLYLERDYANRLLDDDECLIKIAEEIRYGKYLLILKKMIYLTPQIEQRETRADRVRLQIVASQAIYDCKKDKYLLTYKTLLRLAALVGLSQLFKEISPSLLPQQLSLDQIRQKNLASKTRIMVTNSFTSFYDSPATWEHDYQRMICHLFLKLRGICRQNSQVFRTSNIKDSEQQFNTTNLAQLASVSIINEIKENCLYGSISFVVQISEQFRHILRMIHSEQEEDLENRNCWLIIKYHQIYLFSISLKQQLFSINYEDIMKMVSYPASIELRLRGKEVDSLKLKTTCSYSIRELILYYKHYNQMVKKMEEDDNFEESILQFVREYNHTTLEHSFHKKTITE